MVMPRSRSIGLLSSTCSVISRASRPPQSWMKRSARVDLPWSMCAVMQKLRMCDCFILEQRGDWQRNSGEGYRFGRLTRGPGAGIEAPRDGIDVQYTLGPDGAVLAQQHRDPATIEGAPILAG